MATPGKEDKRKKIKFIIGSSRARSSGDGGDSEVGNPPPLPRLPLDPPSSPSGRITVVGGKHLPLLRGPPSSFAYGDSVSSGFFDRGSFL
jgi:hypothetical protein